MGTQIWIFGFLLILTPSSRASWGTPGQGQYHIQTDEGPERYFRYQTDNGQYRKEKRLQDGTVIGTDAWIDASGYLRQKDYIADGQGYRILKSKTVFVGRGRPIEEAIKSVKNAPAQAGILVKPGGSTTVSTERPVLYSSTTPTSVPTTRPPQTYKTNVTPSPYLGYDHYPTPQVFIRPHSHPIEENYGAVYGSNVVSRVPVSTLNYPSSTARPYSVPSNTIEPPYGNSLKPIAIYPTSSTPTPITTDFGSPIAVYPSSSPLPPISSTTTRYSTSGYPSTTTRYSTSGYPSTTPTYLSSTRRPDTYSSTDNYRYYDPISSTSARPNAFHTSTPNAITPLANNNVDVQPLYNRRPSSTYGPPSHQSYAPLQYNNNLGSGYDPQYPYYDGVSATRDGFRYYLPRQYHEEENVDPQRRAGSFGYIDPFGIRRVIYYNTAPGEGFVHRKNNRYVGFNATPYDPRPL